MAERSEEHEGYDPLRTRRRSLRGMIGWVLLERVRLVAWWHAFHGPTLGTSTCEDGNIPHVDTDAVRQAEDVARRTVDRLMRTTRDVDSARVHQPLTGTERGNGRSEE